MTAEHIRTRLTWIQRDTKATWYLVYILHFIRWFTPSFNSRTVQVVGSVSKSERHRPKSQEQVDLLRLALNSSRGKGLTQCCNCTAQKEKEKKTSLSLFSHPRLGSFHPVRETWWPEKERESANRVCPPLSQTPNTHLLLFLFNSEHVFVWKHTHLNFWVPIRIRSIKLSSW